MKRAKWLLPVALLTLLSVGACQKPDQPQPDPVPAPEPAPQQKIVVSTTSQTLFSNGISFNSGEDSSSSSGSGSGSGEGGSGSGSGSGSGEGGSGGQGSGSSEPQPQTQTVNFTAPAAWTATVAETKADGTKVEATKAASWLTVAPSSGGAGEVTMTVTAQPNDTYEDRAASVTIKSGTASSTFAVKQAGKPRPVEVTEVKLDKTELNLVEGDAETITATVLPDNADDKTVTWSSSDAAVATVENGKVTAVKAGEATITAKAGEKTAECKVTVKETPSPAPDPTPDPTPDPGTGSDPGSGGEPGTGQGDESGSGNDSGAGQGGESGSGSDSGSTPQPPATIVATAVTLNKTSLDLTEGDAVTLIATVQPENTTDKTVIWSTSDSSIARVDENGKVTAVKAGSATITAMAGDVSNTCSVTVKAKVIAVASIQLNKTKVTLHPGETDTLVATILPDNASDQTITWTSSYPAAVTVDDTGKITAIAVGASAIHASCGGKSVTCEVTVDPIPVESVSLNKTELNLKDGDSETLIATVKPDDATDKTVTWSTSDASVATVDQNGRVTAVKEGTATITAKAGEKTATCMVTVSKNVVAVTSVTLNKTDLSLKEGESETLTATVKPDDATDKTLTWSTSDASVATVDQNGKVTAVKEGTATITAKAGDKSATCMVTVSKNVVTVTSVTLNKTELSLKEGESETLTATVKPDDATDKTVTWSTSDASVATVDQNGKVTAVKEGTATITAKAGEKTATCTVTVSKNVVAVTSVTLNKTELSLKEGESETLTATVKPDDATDKTVTWSTSDASVATVDQNGRVTAVKEGTATITAKAGSKSATCSVGVKAAGAGTSIEGFENNTVEW